MPLSKVAAETTDPMFDVLAEYEDMLRGCEVGEYYDMPIEEGQVEEEVRRSLSLAARSVLGKRLRISARDEDGKHILRVFVTNVPAVQKPLTRGDVLKTFHVQEYYDTLIREAKPGNAYEIVVTDVPYTTVMRHLDTAGRNILGRQLAFRLRRESKNKVILRYEVTSKPSMPIGQHRAGRRQTRQAAIRKEPAVIAKPVETKPIPIEEPREDHTRHSTDKQRAKTPGRTVGRRKQRDPAPHDQPGERPVQADKRPRRSRKPADAVAS